MYIRICKYLYTHMYVYVYTYMYVFVMVCVPDEEKKQQVFYELFT